MRKATFRVLLLTLIWALVSSAPSAHPHDGECPVPTLANGTFQELVAAGGAQTTPYAINDGGDVIGASRDETTGAVRWFLLRHGEYTTIDVPGCDDVVLRDVNNRGVVLGACFTTTNRRLVGFTWTRGRARLFEIPGYRFTSPASINDAGLIAGTYASRSDEDPQHAFVLLGRTFATIDYPGATNTSPINVDAAGNVLVAATETGGTTWYIFAHGAFERLPACARALQAASFRETAPDGSSAGSFRADPYGFVGFQLSSASLTLIAYPGAVATELLGTNASGAAVGQASLPAGDGTYRTVGFIYRPRD